ncbi:MAG: hypothetical protein JO122_04215 [Acetobacteraceae bacterium]|nr:hypothetical protein [Acetobacteraceae bacterium]
MGSVLLSFLGLGLSCMGHLAAGAGAVILALGVQGAAAAPACHGPTLPESVPSDLAQVVIETFHVTMTPADVEYTGFIRCDHGVMLACLAGANLNCFRGDGSQSNKGAE